MSDSYDSDVSLDENTIQDLEEDFIQLLDDWIFAYGNDEKTPLMYALTTMMSKDLLNMIDSPTVLCMEDVVKNAKPFYNFVPCQSITYPYELSRVPPTTLDEYDWHDMYNFLCDFMDTANIQIPDHDTMFQIMVSVTMRTPFSTLKNQRDKVLYYIQQRRFGISRKNTQDIKTYVAALVEFPSEMKALLRHTHPQFNPEYVLGRVMVGGKDPDNVINHILSI